MDRATVYTQEQGRSVDFLFAQRATMIAVAKLAQAAFGSNTFVRGLAVTPNSPAALNVLVGIGEIYSMTAVDATTWGALGADTTDIILKQGLNMSAQTVATPAPLTPGYSINYLIEAQYQDQDTTPVVLPFYNSSNPQQPLNGQGGNGATLPTQRQGVCVIQAKAGVAATTGTQVTPSVDSGWTALAVVTVANGQSTVTSGNISVPAGVPQVSSLLQMIQTGSPTYAVDTSTTPNQISLALTPALTSYTDGQEITFKAANSNTGPCTVNAGPGSVNLIGAAGALQGGEIVAGSQYTAIYSASLSELVLNSQTGGAEQVAPATKSEHAAQLAQIGGLGQCYFQYTSATSCTLVPKGGNAVTVNGVPLILPSAGLTVSNSGLAANTLYYAYLGGTTASPTLTFSTTGHSTAANGVETQTGNTALTLVGMVYTNSSSQFVGGAGSNSQSVISWFNRKNLCALYANGGASPTFTNTAIGAIWSAASISFLTWADDSPSVACNAAAQLSAAGASMAAQLYIDGASSSNSSQWNASVASGVGTIAILAPAGHLSEGFHISQIYGNVSSGQGALQTVIHQAFVRG